MKSINPAGIFWIVRSQRDRVIKGGWTLINHVWTITEDAIEAMAKVESGDITLVEPEKSDAG